MTFDRIKALLTGLCFAFAIAYGLHKIDKSELFNLDQIHDTNDFVKMIDGSVVVFALFAAGAVEFFSYIGYALRVVTRDKIDALPELNRSNILFVFFLGMLSVAMYITLPFAARLLEHLPQTP